MDILQAGQTCDLRINMYPTYVHFLEKEYDSSAHPYSTVYGCCLGETQVSFMGRYSELGFGDFFSFPLFGSHNLKVSGKAPTMLAFRYGFQGQTVEGSVDNFGRLSYIDGCSDSLLVYPPRKGDPCLNVLHIPPGIRQTEHTHPSVRVGLILSGQGFCKAKGREAIRLESHTMFVLHPNEKHYFETHERGLVIVVYHPDSSWGPEDENHAMLNRTYIE
jgi:quercetin dioxygenase-like cupin family protein